MTGELFALAAAVFWSLHMIFAKKAQSKNIQSANPVDPMIGLFITIFVNNVINIFALSFRHFALDPVPINSTGVIVLALAGLSNSFAGRGLLFASVSILGAAKTGLTKTTMPVFVLIGGVFVLGERFGQRAWLGIGIVLFGLFLMSLDTVRRENKKLIDTAQLMKGIALGLSAAMIMGTGGVLRKAGVNAIPDTILAVSIGSFAALFACVTVLLIKGKGMEILLAVKNIDFNYMMSGVFASAALYTMVYSLRLIPVAITNSIIATEPLFTILFVWLMKEGKREKMGIQTLLFGIIMVTGTIILVTN